MCSPGHTWACPHVGFPIRISPVQTDATSWLELFAVYRVLHRRLTPLAFTVCPCSFSEHKACALPQLALSAQLGCAAAEKLNRWRYISLFALLCYALGKEHRNYHLVIAAGRSLSCPAD